MSFGRPWKSWAGSGGQGADLIVVDTQGKVLEVVRENLPRVVLARDEYATRNFFDANRVWWSQRGVKVLGVDADFTKADRPVIRVVVATPEKRGHWLEGTADNWELFDQPGRDRAAQGLNAALNKAVKMLDGRFGVMACLDPESKEEDRREIARAINEAFRKCVVPALRKYRDWGADDTEGHYHARWALIDYVKREMDWWGIAIEDHI